MKTFSFLLLLTSFSLIACDNGRPTAQETREGVRDAVNAPTDYISGNIRAGQQAQATTALSSVNNAVRMFQAAEGRNPRDLNELVSQNYLPSLPALPSGASYNYNAQTGQVTLSGY